MLVLEIIAHMLEINQTHTISRLVAIVNTVKMTVAF